MIKDKYLREITKKINKFSRGKNLKFFLFGSSLTKDHFGDLDLGVLGKAEDRHLNKLKEEFDNSTLPYFIDIINFNKVTNKFKNNVFSNKILWIRH